jgi:hypothetical protein
MGISPTHFNDYISKQQIKGIYLVVKLGAIDITADYEINKPSVNSKSIAICALNKDTGLSHEFSSVLFFFF